jgi:hypothetical protein
MTEDQQDALQVARQQREAQPEPSSFDSLREFDATPPTIPATPILRPFNERSPVSSDILQEINNSDDENSLHGQLCLDLDSDFLASW